ncbi:hypothetical protein [Nonomuraea sp. NPDC052265]|uniref:hypothetical protein n=1 Tax=Nonomuraea sp. NPDC052265 TaxID=3364374 RepID=UPI0037C5E6EF
MLIEVTVVPRSLTGDGPWLESGRFTSLMQPPAGLPVTESLLTEESVAEVGTGRALVEGIFE